MDEPENRRNWLTRIGLFLLGLLVLLLIVAVGLWLWIRSDAGRNFVEATLEEMDFAGQSVELDGLNGSLLGRFEINTVTLTGRDGVWMVARNVSVDWSPRALLSKTLDVDQIQVGDLDLLQQPVLIPGEGDDEPAITRFAIKTINLPDIFIAEPVLGRDIQLSASGGLNHGPDGGTTQFSAESDFGDTASADLAWSRLLVLSGTADVQGAPDGLIARLLQLDAGQSIDARVRTENDETRLMADIDGVLLTDLNITRSQSQINISGTLNPEPLPFLSSVQPYLGGETAIIATLPRDEGALASIKLTAPRITLSATGRQSGDAVLVDALNLEATELSLADMQVATFAATGRATIGETLSFDGQIDGRNISYQDYRIDRLSGPANLTFDEGSLDFYAELTGSASQSPARRADGAVVNVTGLYGLDDQSLSLSQADIRIPGLSFQGSASARIAETPDIRLSGQYDIDTRVFRDTPAARLRGEATLRRADGVPVMNVSGRAINLSGLPDAVRPLSSEAVTYSARVRFENGIMRVPQLQFGNERFNATGSARWSDGELAADLAYEAADYAYAAIQADTIRGQAVLDGSPDNIQFQTDLTARSAKAGGVTMDDVSLDMAGRYAKGRLSANGSVDAEAEQGPIRATGDITYQDGGWNLSSFDGSLGALTAQGTVSGVGGDISALGADLTLSGSTPFIPAESIDGTVRIGDARVDIDTRLTRLQFGAIEVAETRLRATGPRDAVNFSATANGQMGINDTERALSLEASGLVDLTEAQIDVESEFSLDVGSQTIRGSGAAQQQMDRWSTKVHAEALGGIIQAALTPGDIPTLTYQLDRISVPALARLLARPATEGTLSGTGVFRDAGGTIEGETVLNLDDLRSPISQSEAISVMLRAELISEQLTATLKAREGGLSGQAQVIGPVRTFARAPFIQWPPEKPLQGRADLRGQVGPLAEVFLPPRTDVAGRVDTDLRFSVPLGQDGVTGDIALKDGVFEQGDIGLRLENIQLAAAMQGRTVRIPALSADGVRGGRLSGSGEMGIGEGTGTVDIQATKLRIIDRREGMAEVSGELSLSRTSELLRLAGQLRVTDADIDIGRLPKPGLPTLDVNFGEAQTDEEAPRRFASSRTEFDIDVISAGRINVKGRGLDALMGVDAFVTGSFDDPTVTGEMSIARGRFDFLGKRFEFRDSSVLLRDEILQSILAFEAVRQTSDLRAVVQVTGTIERPEIELTAEPTLPEDEVLSRVLFGRSPTQLSAIETARLAAALTQLSGGSGFDLFGSLENAVGLDTLEIGQAETGQTQLTTGKYLSDDVYLEVRTAAEGTPGIAVEWQVRDNVSLEAETLPDERQRLSVQWKKDFD